MSEAGSGTPGTPQDPEKGLSLVGLETPTGGGREMFVWGVWPKGRCVGFLPI